MPDANAIGENVGRVFRFLLPGLIILGGAAASHPKWFAHANLTDSGHLASLAAIALAAGNAWYVFHRYVIHQLIDWLLYLLKLEGPVPSGSRWKYNDDVASYVLRSYMADDKAKRAQEALALRASHVLFMYVVSEVALVFAWSAQPESVLAANAPLVVWLAIAGLVGATWQEIITRRIDAHVVAKSGGST